MNSTLYALKTCLDRTEHCIVKEATDALSTWIRFYTVRVVQYVCSNWMRANYEYICSCRFKMRICIMWVTGSMSTRFINMRPSSSSPVIKWKEQQSSLNDLTYHISCAKEGDWNLNAMAIFNIPCLRVQHYMPEEYTFLLHFLIPHNSCYIQHGLLFLEQIPTDPHFLLVNYDRVHLEPSNWKKTSLLNPLHKASVSIVPKAVNMWLTNSNLA